MNENQIRDTLYEPNQNKKGHFENSERATSNYLFGNPVLAAKHFEAMK